KSLGFDGQGLERLIACLDEVHGILLVTGPTGSGKTTTLYTALDRLNKPDVKIVTVEDPVEYQMPGINQIQVKPQIELTFAHALRKMPHAARGASGGGRADGAAPLPAAGRHHALPAGRMSGMRRHGISRTRLHHRDAHRDRRDPLAHHAPRDRR